MLCIVLLTAEMVDQMVARKKMPAEMMQYFHAKLALCERCCSMGEVLSIIRGLPLELQANARVFKCRMADELYSGFLNVLDHYKGQVGKDLIRRGVFRRRCRLTGRRGGTWRVRGQQW